MIAAATAPTKDGFPMYDTSVGWNLVVDALKSLDQLVQAGELRRHLIEKNGGCHDTFRRYHGLYGVSAEKFFQAYREKHEKTMKRWKR